jgi:hypothetical protein
MSTEILVSTATMPVLSVPPTARELDALSLVIDHDAAAALNLLLAYLEELQSGVDRDEWRVYRRRVSPPPLV